jgi:hypothetical protein
MTRTTLSLLTFISACLFSMTRHIAAFGLGLIDPSGVDGNSPNEFRVDKPQPTRQKPSKFSSLSQSLSQLNGSTQYAQRRKNGGSIELYWQVYMHR